MKIYIMKISLFGNCEDTGRQQLFGESGENIWQPKTVHR